MRKTRLALAAVAVGMLFVGCPPMMGPDLQVTEFSVGTVPSETNVDGYFEVPVQMTVRNAGNQAAAEVFKVAVYYTNAEDQTFVAAFTVEGESDIWYPHTDGALAAGAEVEFDGIVSLPGSLEGTTVILQGEADSTSGDESIPEYGRVDETRDSNNLSTEVGVDL